jgi:hypothetical protein
MCEMSFGQGAGEGPGESVTCFSISRFELIQLRIALAGEPAFRCLAVKVGTGAVVKGGVQIDPHLSVGIALYTPEPRGPRPVRD